MSTKMITDYAGMVTSITAVLAGILAILKYFNSLLSGETCVKSA